MSGVSEGVGRAQTTTWAWYLYTPHRVVTGIT